MLLGVKADTGQSYQSIEVITLRIRQKLGLGPVDRFPSVQFFDNRIQKLKHSTRKGEVGLHFGPASLRGSDGITSFNQETNTIEMALSERCYELFCEEDPRATFCAAHEYGHGVLHVDQLMRLSLLHIEEKAAMHRRPKEYKAYMDTEWQANAFAGALLMPVEGLKMLKQYHRALFPEDIVSKYGVSLEAACTRAKVFREFSL